MLKRKRILCCLERDGDDVGNYEEFITNYMPPEWRS